jgi:hypothetical protein
VQVTVAREERRRGPGSGNPAGTRPGGVTTPVWPPPRKTVDLPEGWRVKHEDALASMDAYRRARRPDRVRYAPSGSTIRAAPPTRPAAGYRIYSDHPPTAGGIGRPANWAGPRELGPSRTGGGHARGVASSQGVPLGAGRRSARAGAAGRPRRRRPGARSGRDYRQRLSAAHTRRFQGARPTELRAVAQTGCREVTIRRPRATVTPTPPSLEMGVGRLVGELRRRRPLSVEGRTRSGRPGASARTGRALSIPRAGEGDRARAVRTAARACQPLRGAGRAIVLRAG